MGVRGKKMDQIPDEWKGCVESFQDSLPIAPPVVPGASVVGGRAVVASRELKIFQDFATFRCLQLLPASNLPIKCPQELLLPPVSWIVRRNPSAGTSDLIPVDGLGHTSRLTYLEFINSGLQCSLVSGGLLINTSYLKPLVGYGLL